MSIQFTIPSWYILVPLFLVVSIWLWIKTFRANQMPWYKSINFIPVLTIDVKTFLLNILMLVPLGFFLPLLRSKSGNAASVAKFAFCVSLSLEVLQMVIRATLGSGRSTDINDIIANTLGGVVGFLIYKRLTQVNAIRSLTDRSRLG